MYIDKITKRYPITVSDILAEYPNTSFSTPFVAPSRYELVFPTPQPEFDPITHGVRQLEPARTDKGHLEQVWEVYPLEPEQVELNLAAKQSADDAIIASKIETLWSAADKYVSSYISGVAIALLTVGVIKQTPKALAISQWSESIWSEYYVRKAAITPTSELNLDFSSFGPIPFSVPELREEVL